MSIGRDLERTLSSLKEPVIQKDQNGLPVTSQQQTVVNMLGLMGSIAADTIISDIQRMLDKNLNSQLDGYIFALSRIMRHDLAWQCISEAFRGKNKLVPDKYYPHFNDHTEINRKITPK